MSLNETERLIKSKQRVTDHGEVFTPSWLVEDMLNLVNAESGRIDSRVLRPCLYAQVGRLTRHWSGSIGPEQ